MSTYHQAVLLATAHRRAVARYQAADAAWDRADARGGNMDAEQAELDDAAFAVEFASQRLDEALASCDAEEAEYIRQELLC